MLTTFNSLPNDAISTILSFMPLQSVIRNKRVCQRWNGIVSAPNFFRDYFPDVKVNHLPLMPPDRLILLLNSYSHNDSKNLRKFSLHGCRSIDENLMEKVTSSFQYISLKPASFEWGSGAEGYIEKLQESAEIKIRSGLGIETTFIFRSIENKKMSLRKLDLKGFSKASGSDEMFIRPFFFNMLNACPFLPGFHLDLRGEQWVDGFCLHNLEQKKILFSYLALPSSDFNFCLFVENSLFTTPCEIVTEWPMTVDFLKTIIQKKLQIKRLFIDESIPEETVCKIFESHLASPCKVDMPPTQLTANVLEIILKRKIVFEKLFIRDENWKKVKPENYETYRRLFSEVRIRFLNIKGIGTDPALDNNFPSLLKENVLTRLKVTKDDDVFYKLYNLAKSALLSGDHFSLSLNAPTIFQQDINVLVKPNLKFRKLEVIADPLRSYFTIDCLIKSGSLDNCEELYLNASCQNQNESVQKLSSRNFVLRKLQVHVDGKGGTLKTKLSSIKVFPLLNTLIINGGDVQAVKETLASIMKRRPNLNVHFEKKDPSFKKC